MNRTDMTYCWTRDHLVNHIDVHDKEMDRLMILVGRPSACNFVVILASSKNVSSNVKTNSLV